MSHAILSIQLGHRVTTSLDYDTAKAMSARCNVNGVVWNAEESGPKFQGASVHVTFINSIDDRMEKYADEHGLLGACGSIEVAKNLDSERFEVDGKTLVLPQINIWVGVDEKSFRLIEGSLMPSSAGDGSATMSVNFGHRDFAGIVMPLEELDISEKSNYPIVSFNVSCSRSLTQSGI